MPARTSVKTTKPPANQPVEFSEVRTVWTEKEANGLLKLGWLLMCSHIAHMDMAGFQAKPCYILAKRK